MELAIGVKARGRTSVNLLSCWCAVDPTIDQCDQLPVAVRVHAPDVRIMTLVVQSIADGSRRHVAMQREAPAWVATTWAADGDRYWLVADGLGPLVDPSAQHVLMTERGPVGVVRREPWPLVAPLGRHPVDPVVYELHARGFAGTFGGAIERLPYLRDLGIDVIEVMPIHPFDTTDNYWGYMPIVWGAVHQPYADGPNAAVEFARFVDAAHHHGLAVWVDVVFNHTGEGDASMPTWTLRGLDDAHAYRRHADGRYMDDSGCGNDVDSADPNIRALVMEGLQRYADLGVDGFRFDLASLLTRDGGGLVRQIGDWAETADRVVVAEPWDMNCYMVGDAFPDHRWLQWNDRFRDDVRGFLRAEPGLVPAMVERVGASPALFGGVPRRTVNFLTAHDGLTMHDLTAVTSDRHRSWDCGAGLRHQQLANAFGLLLLSAGPAMFVMGDEFARTQRGHDNPYDIDSELTWLDWSRLDQWRALHDVVTKLLLLRRRADFDNVRCYGADGPPDVQHESRSLAWCTGQLMVLANMDWEPMRFTPQEPGPWRVALVTAEGSSLDADYVVVPARALAVLERDRQTQEPT
jgi:isoamylase